MSSKAMAGKPDSSSDCDNAKATSSSPSPPSSSSSTTAPPPKSTSSTRANSALSNPSSRKPRKRAKVSFSAEVISKDGSGDGSRVSVKEEHGIFLGPLLGRMMVSSDAKDEVEGTDTSVTSASSSSEPVVSFALDGPTSEKLYISESPNGGILKPVDSAQPLGDSSVDYDNLVVQMGLLKCGHRYRVVVPVPDYWNKKGDKESTPPDKDELEQEVDVQSNETHHAMDVRIAEDSLDHDLRGEVQTEDADVSGSSSQKALRQHSVCITLSARRRGPYRGRFVLELIRLQDEAIQSQSISTSGSSQNNKYTIENSPSEPKHDSKELQSSTSKATPSIPQKCLMSLQVDATIMGKDMGTPKLRNGVVCLGKMVGYDSDEETEWQGFD